ncbi:hypothetical protein [Streptomyces sp. NPDC059010]|uniref:hypothetical protein n=1 Tax=Streptomyces sp. NPDC059010 TaxID=3346695 RepID=UPI0036BEE7D3
MARTETPDPVRRTPRRGLDTVRAVHAAAAVEEFLLAPGGNQIHRAATPVAATSSPWPTGLGAI